MGPEPGLPPSDLGGQALGEARVRGTCRDEPQAEEREKEGGRARGGEGGRGGREKWRELAEGRGKRGRERGWGAERVKGWGEEEEAGVGRERRRGKKRVREEWGGREVGGPR